MSDDRAAAIERLLRAAADAHHVFERDALHGVYDEAWPEWYGRHIVEHGIAGALGRPVTHDEAGNLLARAWEAFQRLDPKAHDWAAWTARRMAEEL